MPDDGVLRVRRELVGAGEHDRPLMDSAAISIRSLSTWRCERAPGQRDFVGLIRLERLASVASTCGGGRYSYCWRLYISVYIFIYIYFLMLPLASTHNK